MIVGIAMIAISVAVTFLIVRERSRAQVFFDAEEVCDSMLPREPRDEWIECFKNHAFQPLYERIVRTSWVALSVSGIVSLMGLALWIRDRPEHEVASTKSV